MMIEVKGINHIVTIFFTLNFQIIRMGSNVKKIIFTIYS